MDKNLAEQVKQRVKIEDIVSETVDLKKSGSALTGYCPFHNNTNTPAFVVWPQTGTWHCFGACGEGGDVIAFVMKRDNIDFLLALEQLAKRAGIETSVRPWAEDRLPREESWQDSLKLLCKQFRENLLGNDMGRAARAYLHGRGLTRETLAHFDVGWNPVSRFYGQHYVYGGIIIPHYHRDTQTLWGVKIRLLREGIAALVANWQRKNPGQEVPEKLHREKYRTVAGTQQSLYNADDLPAERVLVCEGEFDVMLAWQEARDLITPISLGSASSRLSYQWMQYTLPTRLFLLALDNDPAGNNARRLWSAVVGERGRDLHGLEPGQDLTDYWKLHGGLRQLISDYLAVEAPGPAPQPVIEPEPELLQTIAPETLDLWELGGWLNANNIEIAPGSLTWQPNPDRPETQRPVVKVRPKRS